MAFVYTEERVLFSEKVENQDIGPGSYEIPDKYAQINKIAAPFNSTLSKMPLKQQQIPGVGDYNIQNPLGSPKAKTYKCKNDLIIKMDRQQSSAFRSLSPRFIKVFSEKTPGVGFYDVDKDINPKSFQKKTAQQKFKGEAMKENENMKDHQIVKEFLKSQKKVVNSIPTKQIIKKDFTNKLNIGQQEVLFNSTIHHSLVQEHKDISPGKYSNLKFIRSDIGSIWSKNKGQRFDQYKSKGANIGPGKYNLKNIEVKDQDRVSASYASTTTRSFWDNIYFKTNKDLEAQEKAMNMETVQQGPAPNSYYKEHVVKAMNTEPNTHNEYQFFGATSPRFKQMKPDINIAPGDYQIRTENYKTTTSFSPPFNTSSERVNLNLKRAFNLNPGPGDYGNNHNTLSEKIKEKKEKGYVGKFGQTAERFKMKNIDNVFQPGPALYQPQNYKTFNSYSDQFNETHGFKSLTARNVFKIPEDQSPNLYSYNVQNFDINQQLAKQKEYQEKLKKINVQKPGFNSNEERFKHYIVGSSQKSRSLSPSNTRQQLHSQQQYVSNNYQDGDSNQHLLMFEESTIPHVRNVKSEQFKKQHNRCSIRPYGSPQQQQKQYLEDFNGKFIFNQTNFLMDSDHQEKFTNFQINNKNIEKKGSQNSPKKQLLKHNIPPTQPFMFNSKKLDSIYKDTPDTVGPGYYDVKDIQWIKKSYNKKFEQQDQYQDEEMIQ